MAALAAASVGIPEATSARRKANWERCDGNRRWLLPVAVGVRSARSVSGEQKASSAERGRRWRVGAGGSPSPVAERGGDNGEKGGRTMSIDLLRRFFELNVGKWNGSFYQFDPRGSLLQNVATRLSASSYGEDELISLIQTLYIKQARSRTFTSEEDDEPEWTEYKIKETNIFTADKYQQIGFFPKEKAFSLRYQTAGMLETVLRAGVLGEDDTGEECPRNLMLPSRRPALVCENCLNSIEKDLRARAFHILDPKGVPEMFLIFLEGRGSGVPDIFSMDSPEGDADRLAPLLGRWEGRSVTKRSGIYGSTIAEAEVVAQLETDGQGRIIQDMTSRTSGSGSLAKVHWTGVVSGHMATFEGGYQMTLLPGGMYVGCPCDVSRSVAEMQAFHLEFCWMESPSRRQRLIRTYDAEGLPVSSTYFLETKV
ncbi:unnamed protein product [Spirodela intermedia]|uniref:Uncharacterized protein n=1 Tax=Spirodela intermedia TaxID=51605 RepID=A0A7I8JBC4_SPIIN|nr:unnamed protein product [Spirodela intermedia]CAA6667384.1 unnamed protein product [Spirodela intermedia]